MRLSLAAAAACCCLLPIAAGLADAPAAQPASAASAAPAAPGDAAAKHAKRTACLKDAKAKKLVGAEKTTYLKNCMAEP